MEKYVVGGAVRDKLLGKEPHDKDYVVVGSTIEEMLSLGYKQVGKDFPVFLDEDGNEIALARKERKIGDKHTDFEFLSDNTITLFEDLSRRDFAMNAIAYNVKNEDCWSCCLNDPFNGVYDIQHKLIRHIGDAFMEDNLRVLRANRFSAQLGFDIAPETMELMKKMVKDGMLAHLTPERVWKETEKALSKGYDSKRYFEGLNECGALEVLFPELYALVNTPEIEQWHPSENAFKHTMIALDMVKDCQPLVKFSVVMHDLGKGTTPKDILPHHYGHENRGEELIDILCERLRVPNDYKKFAKTFSKNHMKFYKMLLMKLHKKYLFVKELSDGFKNKELLLSFIQCFKADFFGEIKQYSNEDYASFADITKELVKICDIMANVHLEDLPIKTQEKLSKLSGQKFGQAYTESMVKYLSEHI